MVFRHLVPIYRSRKLLGEFTVYELENVLFLFSYGNTCDDSREIYNAMKELTASVHHLTIYDLLIRTLM